MKASEYLSAIDYPGRIILLGYDRNGGKSVVYAITGRGRNSRNRVLAEEDGVVRTQPYDPSEVEDPSLIIYNAVRAFQDRIICTNGDHTDTIFDALAAGGDIEDALIKRTYEPDGPAFTPRISGVIDEIGYSLSIIRKDGDETLRLLYRYGKEPGVGHIIHTYKGNGDPLPSFDTLPVRIDMTENIADEIWESLGEYRVSLFSLAQGRTRIMNIREEENGKA